MNWYRIKRLPRDIERWFAYRTYDKYHLIRVDGVEKTYSDKDTQMLGAMFGLLVDFVEAELASHSVWDGSIKRSPWEKIKYRIPFVEFRSREVGIKHLDWAASLVYDEHMGVDPSDPLYGKPTHQAEAAKEQKALYLWWKDDRPNRPDPIDVSGFSELCRKYPMEWRKVEGNDNLSEMVGNEERSAAAMRSHEIEEAQHAEDQTMLHRLIEIRRSLWT